MNADWTPRRRKRRTFGAPGAIALIVLILAAGVTARLALAPPAPPPSRVVLALSLPTEVKMTLAPPAGEPVDAAPPPTIDPVAGPPEVTPEAAIAVIAGPAAPAMPPAPVAAMIAGPRAVFPPAAEVAGIASRAPPPTIGRQVTETAAAMPEPWPEPAPMVIAAATPEPRPEPGPAAAAATIPEPQAAPAPAEAAPPAFAPEPQRLARRAPGPESAPAKAAIGGGSPEPRPQPEAAAATTIIAAVTPEPRPEPRAATAATAVSQPDADEEAAIADLGWSEPEPERVAAASPTPQPESVRATMAIAAAAPEPTPEPEATAALERRIEPATTLERAPAMAAIAPAAGPPAETPPAPRLAVSHRLEAASREEAPMVTAALAPETRVAPPPLAAGADLPADALPEAKMPPPATADADARVGETWIAYARPFDPPQGRPLIAVVVTGLGLSQAATAAAIRLPSAVTLGFSSYARDLQEWIDLARASGHEVILDLPMEPVDYPAINPGPQALLTSLTAAENAGRLEWHLDRATGYIGVTHNMGSRFTASPDDMRPVLSTIKARGLMFLDSRTTSASVGAALAVKMALPRAANDRFLDAEASRPAIDRRLAEVERIARRTGYSVTVGHAFPVTLDRLADWLETFEEKGIALAPISAVVNKQNLN